LTPRYVSVGKLGRPRGVHGEIWITPDTDFLERFADLKLIYLRNRAEWEEFKVISSRVISNRPAIRLEGIKTPEDASRLTNRELAVIAEDIVELPSNTYYQFDLVGCKVYDDEKGELLGELVDIHHYPANDVYVIRGVHGREVLYPAVKQFIKTVDVENKRLVVAEAGLFGE